MTTKMHAMDMASASDVAEARGRAGAWATVSVLVGILAFVQLGGVEKALLAVAFGLAALRGPVVGKPSRRARLGIGLGLLMIALVATLGAVFHEQIAGFVSYVADYR